MSELSMQLQCINLFSSNLDSDVEMTLVSLNGLTFYSLQTSLQFNNHGQ